MKITPKIHIGQEIEARINQLRISESDFARLIDTSRQNVNRILKKESIDTAVLQKYCEVLNYNFFSLYCPRVEGLNETSSHCIASKDIETGDCREEIQQKEVSSEMEIPHTSESNPEIDLPPDCSDSAKHIIERLTMEVSYLRNTVSHLQDMNTDKERFINHLLTNKQ